ncbi:ABC transporter ATP-binding protein [Priestia filamentosa]|uniref:Sugar ABC transporter ATP-binding protein n=1 Tax=Priestia filamentosa TaxID=1402861 RepID=A0A1X7EKL8_9BACI|nr:sn-glycerol-3-phosphate ABC transporter ATP-binding protein UgpC [Priestia filamentosa]AKO93082.1 sugar ABC transporter ATP-binding protein [Priestia filamentosa]MDT3763207.1 sn-glycerol-3-phosphate ABC transporter ATP-binding protein UgpC [Priestia filamentosa]OXS69715.1 ABC transporter ATP-binding protein [Priestia filamentosa]RJS63624.1 ABC transporter ATP-binding protein [Priestia filamentosa]WRU93681.1 sn-glycerol-3-phosphate ABC transporter ATP-binding protein UgpC [Priestia filamento
MAVLDLEKVQKVYDKKNIAVQDFNLHIQDKEFIVFVGPSGCGKSTTLRMIAGLEEISDGDFYINGERMNDVASKDRDIAMVFQNYALYPHMTVYDNMAFGLKLKKVKKEEIKRRVNEAAKILGLETYLNRKPKALSGGQRQRVALGRAIVRDAKVFLMDEPLSNLDAKLRVQMRAEIIKLHQRLQTTTIYVTHDQVEAMTMATRLVVMKDGVIQQIGTPQEIYHHPKNVFVGSFIGSPAMNFFKGMIEDSYFIVGKTKMRIPQSKLEMLKARKYDKKEVIIGIRPEHIVYSDVQLENTAKVAAKLEVVEMLGAESILYTGVEDQAFVARVNSPKEFTIGETIHFHFQLEKASFFDIDTEECISDYKY